MDTGRLRYQGRGTRRSLALPPVPCDCASVPTPKTLNLLLGKSLWNLIVCMDFVINPVLITCLTEAHPQWNQGSYRRRLISLYSAKVLLPQQIIFLWSQQKTPQAEQVQLFCKQPTQNYPDLKSWRGTDQIYKSFFSLIHSFQNKKCCLAALRLTALLRYSAPYE